MKLFRTFCDWIFPHQCLSCMTQIDYGSIVCPQCFAKIVFVSPPYCQVCGKMLEVSNVLDMICDTCRVFPRDFLLCRSLIVYNNASKNVIVKIKNQSSSGISRVCSRMLTIKYQDIFNQADIIIPIPSHWTRIIRRSFNPASIIAKELSKIIKKPCKNNLLYRKKQTEYQKHKNIKERKNNVYDAFKCKKNINNQTVLLIDDLLTTGATLNEAARVLKQNGAKNVLAATIATTKTIYTKLDFVDNI